MLGVIRGLSFGCPFASIMPLGIFLVFRFHMGPSVKGFLTVCSNGSAPLNKMAAMPIYGKTT